MCKVKKDLIQRAKEASEKAYAPYSKFKVGAAILSNSGQIFSGCNVENAAYPQGTCAEAGAISAMVLAGDLKIFKIAIFVNTVKFITPCGGCRQKIREFSALKTHVLICDEEMFQKRFILEALLPASFGPDNLF